MSEPDKKDTNAETNDEATAEETMGDLEPTDEETSDVKGGGRVRVFDGSTGHA